jgi:hypothetical protein
MKTGRALCRPWQDLPREGGILTDLARIAIFRGQGDGRPTSFRRPEGNAHG